MALSVNTVWEVRTTGNDANGGGFVTGASGTDRSQQDTAQGTLTTASVVHTTTTQLNVSAGDYTVSAADVGNIFQLAGGTATAGFYQITAADVPNNRWTVDRSLGTAAQTCPGKIGGAVASLGILGHSSALGSDGDGNKVWVKSGTYTLTTSTQNVSGGPLGVFGFASELIIEGYQTTRGDRAARPVLSAGSVTGLSFAISGAGSRQSLFINLEYDANNGSGNVGGFQNTGCFRCVVRNASAANAFGFSGTQTRCAAINCTFGYTGSYSSYCIADSCGTGWNNACTGAFNIAISSTGNGFSMSAGSRQSNSIAYGCLNGFNIASGAGAGTAQVVNCIAYGCGQYGFRSDTVNTLMIFNCAAGSNTSGNTVNCFEDGSITLTSDPFTNTAAKDFSLNNTAGGGALLRAAGIRWGDGFTYDQVNYQDVGVFQHQDTGGSSGPVAQLKQFNKGSPY